MRLITHDETIGTVVWYLPGPMARGFAEAQEKAEVIAQDFYNKERSFFRALMALFYSGSGAAFEECSTILNRHLIEAMNECKDVVGHYQQRSIH